MILTDDLMAQLGTLESPSEHPALAERLSPIGQDGRRDRTRAAILDGVERLISAEDPYALKMRDIADAADVSVGSLYAHFAKKADLPLTLAFDRAYPLIASLDQRRAALSAAHRIVALGDLIATLSARSPAAARALATTRSRYLDYIKEGGTTAPHAATLLRWIDALTGDAQQAQLDGQLLAATDPALFARSLRAFWYGLVVTNCSRGVPANTAAGGWSALSSHLFDATVLTSTERWQPPPPQTDADRLPA